MANRYWVGGTATWDGTAGSKWALTSGGAGGQAVPTSSDDVFFDAGSGTCTVTTSGTTTDVCNNITWSSTNVTISHAAATTITVYGSLDFTGSGTYTRGNANTSRFVFAATATGKNITWASKSPGEVTFDGVGGGWTLQDTFTSASSSASAITLTNGALDTNGKAVTGSFSSSNSNTRSLTLGATTWTIGNNSNYGWNISTSTNMTLSAGSSTISFTLTTGSGQFFHGGGLTYGTVSCTTQTAGDITFSGNNTFGTLTLSQAANINGTYYFTSGSTQTVTGTLTGNGNSALNRCYYRATTVGSAATLSAGTFTFTNIDLQDITKAGAGSGNISAITGGSGDCGGNSGWTFTTPRTCYMKTGASANMSSTTIWFTTSGGSTPISSPTNWLVQDSLIMDANSVTAGSVVITQQVARLAACDWTGVLNTPTFQKSQAASFYGSIKLVAGMVHGAGAGIYTYMGQATSTLTGAGLSWPNSIVVDCGVGTLQLGDNFTSTNGITCSSGTFNTQNYTSSFTTIAGSGGTFTSGSGAITLSGGITMTTGTMTVGSGGVAATTLIKNGSGTMTINGASTFSGNIILSSTGTWNINADVTGSGTLAQTGQNVNLTDARLTYNNGYFDGAGSGGSSGGSFTFC